jgi:hypothetical protein
MPAQASIDMWCMERADISGAPWFTRIRREELSVLKETAAPLGFCASCQTMGGMMSFAQAGRRLKDGAFSLNHARPETVTVPSAAFTHLKSESFARALDIITPKIQVTNHNRSHFIFITFLILGLRIVIYEP